VPFLTVARLNGFRRHARSTLTQTSQEGGSINSQQRGRSAARPALAFSLHRRDDDDMFAGVSLLLA
jgi:hypothetical protein